MIAGAGSVGRSIARELLAHEHQVTLIDRQPSAMRVAQVPDAEWLHFVVLGRLRAGGGSRTV